MPKKELTLAEETTEKDNVITLDGKNFHVANFSEEAKSQLDNLQFVNEQIMQKNNDIQNATDDYTFKPRPFKFNQIYS